jgi:hypothetical protein
VSSTSIKQEAAARVAALVHNSGGTYAASSRVTGLSAQSLSQWQRKLHAPARHSLGQLREHTDADEEVIPFTSALLPGETQGVGSRSGKLFGSISRIFSS